MPSTSGKYMRGRIGSTPTVVAGLFQASLREEADRLDATDAESGGYGDTDAGVQQVRGRFRGYHKIGSGPWPGLSVGTVLTNLQLYLQSPSATPLTGPVWTLPSAVVLAAESEVTVRDRIYFNVEIDSKGTYTPPAT